MKGTVNPALEGPHRLDEKGHAIPKWSDMRKDDRDGAPKKRRPVYLEMEAAIYRRLWGFNVAVRETCVSALYEQDGWAGGLVLESLCFGLRGFWKLMAKMQEGGSSVILNWGEDTGLWECSWITGDRRYTGVADDAQMALVQAAYEAVKP